MTNDKGSTVVGIELSDLKATKLRNVAYSADVDTDGATRRTRVSRCWHATRTPGYRS